MNAQQNTVSQSSPLNFEVRESADRLELNSHTGIQFAYHYYRKDQSNRKSGYSILVYIMAILVVVAVYFIYDGYVQQKNILQILERLEKDKYKDPLQEKYQIGKQQSSKIDLPVYSQNSPLLSVKKSQIMRLQYKQTQLQEFLPAQIPKRGWFFRSKQYNASTLWTKKCFDVYKTTLLKMGYQLILFDMMDYSKYVSSERYKVLQEAIQILNHRYESANEPQIIRYRDLIIRQLIIVEVLIENGGIYIDQDLIITEDFQWIRNINNNQYVNAKALIKRAQVVAFHSVKLSPPTSRHSYINAAQTQRYAVINPTVSSYFLASIKSSAFLMDLRTQYYSLLNAKENIKQKIAKLNLTVNFNKSQINIFKYLFQISSQITLHKKDQQLKSQNSTGLQFYQLATINQNYGPSKLSILFQGWPYEKIFNQLAKISNDQLEYLYGKMKFMMKLQPIEEYQNLLLAFVNKENIINGSFIHQNLLQSLPLPYIRLIPKEINSQGIWQNLPNKLWTYDNNHPNQGSILHDIWLKHLQVTSARYNFTLIILNESNLHEYLDKQTGERIQKALKARNKQLRISQSNAKIEMISLAILYQHGGAWIQPQNFLINLQQIRNINRNKFIWNKSGRFPKVILPFHPGYGSLDWKYNQKGIKQVNQLGYEKNIIIAQSKAQFIKDWLDQFIKNMGLSYSDIKDHFFIAKMRFNSWITPQSQELLFLDSVNSALGTKKLEFISHENNTSPAQHYGLWGINGFSSYLKLREYTNFVSLGSIDNPYFWRYSMSEFQELGGNLHFFVKIYPQSAHSIQSIYKSSDTLSPQKSFHKESYFVKLLQSIKETVIFENDRLTLLSEEISLKDGLQEKRVISAMKKVVWVYWGQNDNAKDILNQQIKANLLYYTSKNAFQLQYVTLQNCSKWLKTNTYSTLTLLVKELKHRLTSQKSNLKDHFENLIEQLVTLSLLKDNGGISISKGLILHEDLNWIYQIDKQNFTNKASKSKAKVFAFHSPSASTKAINKNNQSFIQVPSIQRNLIAAGTNSKFISNFLEIFIKVISIRPHIKQIEELGYHSSWQIGKDAYYEAFFIASRLTIGKKQKELRKIDSKLSALQFYGLITMNSRLFVSKINNFLSNLQVNDQVAEQTLFKTSINQLQSYIGPLRYASNIPRQNLIRKCLSNYNNNSIQIVQKSFIHQFLTTNLKQKKLIKYQYRTNATNKQWKELPSLVWIFISKDSPLIDQILVQNLYQQFAKSGYKINKVHEGNIHEYLSNQTLKKLSGALKNKTTNIHREYFYRLSLLHQHGGIALSHNLIPTEHTSWVKNISSFPKQLIFNRNFDNPKVLMFADHFSHSSKRWEYSNAMKTKAGHQLGWKDDFIAAEKGTSLIKDWLQHFTSLIQMDEPSRSKLLEQCQIKQSRLSKEKPSLLRLDSLSCVLNTKDKETQKQSPKKQASIHYGLWGISEYVSLGKLQDALNMDRTQSNLSPLLWSWTQQAAQSVIGKMRLLVRVTDRQIPLLEELIKKKKKDPWGSEHSLIVNTLWKNMKEKIKIENDAVKLDK